MPTSPLKRVKRASFASLNKLFNGFGYRIQRFDQLDLFEPLLYRRLAKAPDFFFVQIGANDGVFADPLRNFVTRNNVGGLVVEPLKDLFDRLVANYRDFPKVRPVNVAIHKTARTIQLHRVDPAKAAGLGDWTQGIASVHEHHHRLSQVPDSAMITEIVPACTLAELFERESVNKVDLLQVDTEGYDFEIIRMIDFQKVTPALIRFEHGLPSATMSVAEFKNCTELLMDNGYYILTEPYDAIAYRLDQI